MGITDKFNLNKVIDGALRFRSPGLYASLAGGLPMLAFGYLQNLGGSAGLGTGLSIAGCSLLSLNAVFYLFCEGCKFFGLATDSKSIEMVTMLEEVRTAHERLKGAVPPSSAQLPVNRQPRRRKAQLPKPPEALPPSQTNPAC